MEKFANDNRNRVRETLQKQRFKKDNMMCWKYIIVLFVIIMYLYFRVISLLVYYIHSLHIPVVNSTNIKLAGSKGLHNCSYSYDTASVLRSWKLYFVLIYITRYLILVNGAEEKTQSYEMHCLPRIY